MWQVFVISAEDMEFCRKRKARDAIFLFSTGILFKHVRRMWNFSQRNYQIAIGGGASAKIAATPFPRQASMR